MSALLGRLARLPGRIVLGVWHFANPQLKAGRIPYARTVLVIQLVAALTFVGYTLVKKQIQLPLVSSPYLVDVVLPDAAGLDPAKEPAAGVAGAQAGRVTEVRIEDGRAIATLRLDSDLEGKIFADATASLRPINVLQVLVVNVLPGSPEAGPLPDGQPIEAERTDTFVHIDELTSVLDADTQAQVRVLIDQAAEALRGREPELRRILSELGDLTETATPLARALEQRRRLLRRLVGHLDTVFATLGERGEQLAGAIEAGSRTLEVTASRETELAAATRELAPTVLQAQVALAAARRFAAALIPALDEIIPVAGELRPAAVKVRELIPQADDFLDQAEALVDEGRRPLNLFEQGTRGLAGRVRRDLIPAVADFGVTIGALDKYKGGIAQTADLWSAAFSASASAGFFTQNYIGSIETTPEGLGLGPAATRSRDGGPSRLQLMLAGALEETCREINPVACLIRFGLRDLPAEPVLEAARGRDSEGEGG